MQDKVIYDMAKLKKIGRQTSDVFAVRQGLILGSSSVVSQKTHLEPKINKGLVHVYMNQDAGSLTLEKKATGNYVHIDVLHNYAVVNTSGLESGIRKSLFWYLSELGTNMYPGQRISPMLILAREIQICIASSIGTALGTYRKIDPIIASRHDHVHILAKLSPEHYPFIQCLVNETEKALLSQGVQLRPVKQIIHIHEMRRYTPPPGLTEIN